ncbi:MAG: hypothetical protein CML47_00180 [Rhodobacteraceae bacterium]|jgi:arylsulfatase A-like enzyme|nr:MAG: hypothetical protein CML47_00180 [Paracoccaceae bacterium]
MNILLFMSDNQSAEFIGCYGNDEVLTPNIDELSKTGKLFSSAFCTNAMCSPCRASVLTGLMPSAHGIHNWLDDNLEKFWPDKWNAIGEFENFPGRLKEAGYTNALIGKYHLGKAKNSPHSFDHWVTFPHGHTTSFYNNQMIDNDENYSFEGHSVDFFTDKTIEFLRSRKGEDSPFFCFVPYNGPYGHWPAIKGRSKNEFASFYDECDIQSVPREGINQRVIDRYTSRVIAAGGKPREQFAGPILLPNEKDSIRNYFSQVSLIDKGIGRIINELETLQLRENTLILYTSDHGFSLGNHGIWGHGLAAWPSSIKKPSFNIPLIFSGPNISNEHSNALVSQLDIGNTILNYVGLDPIKTTYNDSQIIDLKKNNSSFRKALFMEQEETRAIRTEDWLYMERINNQEMPFLNPELYDLRNDPLEYKNLSEEIKYKSIIETLSKKLHDYFKSHSNPKFDLWNGGKAKSNVSSEAFWKKIWGEDWSCTY